MKTVIKMMSGTQKNCSENESAPEVTLNHWTTDAMTEDRRMPGGSNAQKASKSFLEHTIDMGNTVDHSPEQTRQQTPIATITTQNQLQSVNQKNRIHNQSTVHMMQLYMLNKGQGQTHSVSLQKSMESKSGKKDTAIQCGY